MFNQTLAGAVHHDELIYLISAPSVTPLFTKDDPEHKQVERMTRIVANFVKNG